jgi:Zn finger protein HypA/HybF involved in hydrogenase expression
MSAYWCHVCYRTVPASEASTHVHDKQCGSCGGKDGKHSKGGKGK